MSSRLALRELEKKAWLRTFEHGLWDVAIGSMFLMFGLSILVDFPALSGLWIVALTPSLREMGRKLVIPRIGHVQFRDRRRRVKGRLSGILTATMVFGVVFLGFFIWLFRSNSEPAWAQWISHHFVVVIGIIWGGGLVVAGRLVGFPRLYGYGVGVFGSLLVTDLFEGYHLGISLALIGGLIMLIGAALFVRFLRRYPKQEEPFMEPSDD